jgi:hypothetical protein
MFPYVDRDTQTNEAALPSLLGVEDVRLRYGLRSAQAARRVMREAGARSVSGRLFVPVTALASWESSRTVAPPRRRIAATAPAQATVALRGLEAGWWRTPS